MEAVLAWRHTYGEDPRLARPRSSRRGSSSRRCSRRSASAATADRTTRSPAWATGRTFPDWNEQRRPGQREVPVRGRLGDDGVPHLQRAPPAVPGAAGAARGLARDRARRCAPFLEEVLRHTTVVHLRARRATTGHDARAACHRAAATRHRRQRGGQPRPVALARSGPVRPDPGAALQPPRVQCGPAPLRRRAPGPDGGERGVRGLFRAFPDLAPAVDGPQPRAMGFVSRAWWPQVLTHAPRDPADVRSEILAG